MVNFINGVWDVYLQKWCSSTLGARWRSWWLLPWWVAGRWLGTAADGDGGRRWPAAASGWWQNPAQNRAKTGEREAEQPEWKRGRRRRSWRRLPAGCLGGDRRPGVGGRQRREEGEEKLKRAKGGHTGRQGKQREGKAEGFGFHFFLGWFSFYF